MVTRAERYNAAVGAQLRAEIAAHGANVTTTAAKAGVPRGTLIRYLNGERQIPITVVYHVADALGLSPSVIVQRASERFGVEQAAPPRGRGRGEEGRRVGSPAADAINADSTLDPDQKEALLRGLRGASVESLDDADAVG